MLRVFALPRTGPSWRAVMRGEARPGFECIPCSDFSSLVSFLLHLPWVDEVANDDDLGSSRILTFNLTANPSR